MPFTYRCRRGHDRGCFAERSEAVAARADLRLCDCGTEARLRFIPPLPAPGVFCLPEIPEHHNHSLNRTVSSRKHLQHLQQKLGVSDFDPGELRKGPSTGWK